MLHGFAINPYFRPVRFKKKVPGIGILKKLHGSTQICYQFSFFGPICIILKVRCYKKLHEPGFVIIFVPLPIFQKFYGSGSAINLCRTGSNYKEEKKLDELKLFLISLFLTSPDY